MNPVPSTSSSVVREVHDEYDGFDFLERFLLRNGISGICASPFYDKLDSLQHMVSMHGISPHGYTLDECRVVLFRHVFGGDCVSPYVRSHHNDRTACIHFSKSFHSEEEMSSSAQGGVGITT